MDSQAQLLADLLRLQQEVRALDMEQRQIALQEGSGAYYHNALTGLGPTALGLGQYRDGSPSSAPAGTPLVTGASADTPGGVWADRSRRIEAPAFRDVPCANQADCLDENFCYSWWDCDECQWCENNVCVERDPKRPCSSTSECPCPPREDQRYECRHGYCALSCVVNSDCGECEVCGYDGFCGPGCQSDEQCIPGATNAAPDARAGSWCVDCECRTPCDPPRFCRSKADCREGEYCGERLARAQGDPQGGLALHECLSGCEDSSDCSAGESCVDHRCIRACAGDGDCAPDEACNSGECERIGLLCYSSADCPEGEFCSGDGRCKNGCRASDECEAGELCSNGRCIRSCGDSAQCPQGQVCVDGECARPASTDTSPADERFGCDCGESCTQEGQCLPAPCLSDAECESCSYCVDGACVPGCDDENPCPPGEACNPEQRCVPLCTTDADCTLPMVCLEEGYCGLACDPVLPCATSLDCPDGNYCSGDGVCESGCGADADCEAGLSCVDHSCIRVCVSASDCGPDEACVDGVCEYVEPGCVNDLDCVGGICVAGVCRNGCRSDSQCQAGERCVAQECVVPCSDDAECSAIRQGDVCQEGRCVTIASGPTGGGHAGCEVWEQCDELGQCVPVPCRTNADCVGHGDQCLATGFCGDCATDSECPGGRICDDGRCLFQCVPEIPCQGDSDCPEAFYCGSDLICAEGCRAGGCQQGETCIQGVCERACVVDADCGQPTDRCINGACRYVGVACATDADCAETEWCDNGLCEVDYRCISDGDCSDGEVCNQATGMCDASGSTIPTAGSSTPPPEEPSRIGCEQCSQTCGTDFLCHDVRCRAHSDCPCGFCSPNGNCIPECHSNADCANGFCVGGACVECTADRDCLSARGIPGMKCVDNSCRTPCSTGMPEGDCFAGLKPGDPCENCPAGCPPDAPCGESSAVCGASTAWNAALGRAVAVPVYCKRCLKPCLNSAACGPGSVCVHGYCETATGRCGTDSDCVEQGLADGVQYRCLANQCSEVGVVCISGADCEVGEVCDDGTCRAGDCGSANPCPPGKTCFENTCTWECGGTPIACSSTVPCPQGMTCTKGVCVRHGFAGAGSVGCPTGYFCGGGACIPYQGGVRECVEDSNCLSPRVCEQGLCRPPRPPSPQPDPSNNPPTPGVMDPCEALGMSCGQDGFCEPRSCDADHPCPDGKCCDRGSGLCVSRSEHPSTRLGAPGKCTYAPVYCELLDGDGEAFDPQATFESRRFRGCEVVNPITREVRCWDGKPLSEEQVRAQLLTYCTKEDREPCDCEDPPDNECFDDDDCGSCQRCVGVRFGGGDACCGQAEIRNQCVALKPGTPCKCERDADCSECEVCHTLDHGAGYCEPKCAEKCPGGGSLSDGTTCPSCEETYGPCAMKLDVVITPERWDVEKGRLVPAVRHCQCVVNTENDCCEAYQSIEDLASGKLRSGCVEKKLITPDGRTIYTQVAECANFGEGICAKCASNDHCEGNQVCKNGICITECGGQNSVSPGYLGMECACCTEKGDCRALYETWTESDSIGKGPWKVVAQTTGSAIEFTIDTEAYAPAREQAMGRPGVQAILSMTPTQQSGRCRPCACTETGIDCGSYASCDGCYTWEHQRDQSTDETEAEIVRIRKRIGEIERLMKPAEEAVAQALVNLQQAQGQVAYWQNQVASGAPGASEKLEEAQLHQEAMSAIYATRAGAVSNLEWERTALEERAANIASGGSAWRKVKVCDCCIDGFCRPEEDCSYGTCYLCIKRYTNEYGYELRGKTLENKVCVDDGPSFVRLLGEEGTCMKYDCRKGIAWEERQPYLSQTRFFEYCTGSILACGREMSEPGYEGRYKQGWKYHWNLSTAGTYVGGPGTNPSTWTRFLGPEVSRAESSCSYGNPNAFVGGHTLPMIGGALATHECCNEATLWGTCPEDRPMCWVEFETLYEAGDVTLQKRRLEQEIALLEHYLGRLSGEAGQVQAEIGMNTASRDGLIQDQAQKRADIVAIRQLLATAEQQVKDTEQRLTDATSERDSLATDYESQARDAEQARIEYLNRSRELKTAREAVEGERFVLQTAKDNLASATAAWQEYCLRVTDSEAEIVALEAELLSLDPSSLEHFELSAEIDSKRAEVDGFARTRDDLASAMDDYNQQIQQSEEAISGDLQNQVNEAERTAQAAMSEWDNLRDTATETNATISGMNANCSAIYATLAQQRGVVTTHTNNLALAEADAGTRNDQSGEWSGGAIQTAIEDLDAVIESSRERLEAIGKEAEAIDNAVKQRKVELAKLDAAGGPPTVPVGPVPRPSDALTHKELRELFKAREEADRAALKDPDWYPDGF